MKTGRHPRIIFWHPVRVNYNPILTFLRSVLMSDGFQENLAALISRFKRCFTSVTREYKYASGAGHIVFKFRFGLYGCF